jgi:3-oxoacyl-[acyl-carrier protein] reductase
VKSAMTDALGEKIREGILEKVPMKKLGTPEDVAACVIYLASDEAGWVTGQTFHINGGMAMI